MGKFELPTLRTLNSAFKERRKLDQVILIEALNIKDGEVISIDFEGANSPWRQGIWLGVDEFILVEGTQSKSIVLWADTAPKNVLLECHTKRGYLHFYNVWDRGSGMNSQGLSSGMLVEECPGGWRYRCNDSGFETDFSKLVFRISRN